MIPKQTVSAAVFSTVKEKNTKRYCFYTFPISKPIQLIPNNQIFSRKDIQNERKREKTVTGKTQT